MIHRNSFKFDHCGCAIEYDWDDAVPVTERVHKATRSVFKCPKHRGIEDPQVHYDTVVAENRAKNSATP